MSELPKPPRRRRSHFLTLEVESHSPTMRKEILESVYAWLEIHRRSTEVYGFDLISVIADRGKRFPKRIKRRSKADDSSNQAD